jgi:hypothetical protein
VDDNSSTSRVLMLSRRRALAAAIEPMQELTHYQNTASLTCCIQRDMRARQDSAPQGYCSCCRSLLNLTWEAVSATVWLNSASDYSDGPQAHLLRKAPQSVCDALFGLTNRASPAKRERESGKLHTCRVTASIPKCSLLALS